MNEKVTLTRSEIEKKFNNLIIKNFNENLEEAGKFIRHNSGIIIAAAFSMIILLLSFITQRSILLDTGIIFLISSIIFQYELFHLTPKLTNIPNEIHSSIPFKISKNQAILQIFGTCLFFLGLIFLFSHFQMYFISFGLIVYLNIKRILQLKSTRDFIIKLKNDKFEKDKFSIALIDLQISKEVIEYFKTIRKYEILIEIIIIVCSAVIIMDWIFVIIF